MMRKTKSLPKKKTNYEETLSVKLKLSQKPEEDDDDDDDDSKSKKSKTKREPLPMKMRAFPQSFWQEPNTSGIVLPTNYCSPLQEEADRNSHSLVIGKANTDLLFSLFQNVNREPEKEKQLPAMRRGRPRKVRSPYQAVKCTKDEDPYFTSAIVPVILSKDEEKIVQEQKIMALISVTGENDNVPLNSSYSERLSDLVVNL